MPYISIDNASQLRNLFTQYNRGDSFSLTGYNLLWDYLCEYEDSSGEKLEIDVVGLCCDFNEDDYESIAQNYSIDLPEREDFMEHEDNGFGCPLPETFDEDAYAEAVREAVLDYLNDHTTVCGYDDDIVVFAVF